MEVGYVKTAAGLEVDFLVRSPEGGEELIQVSADVADAKTLTRELRAMADAVRRYPQATRRLLVLDRDAPSGVDEPGLVVQPAYEWLLEQPA